MSDLIPPPADAIRNTHCTPEQYETLYRRSLDDQRRLLGRAGASGSTG